MRSGNAGTTEPDDYVNAYATLCSEFHFCGGTGEIETHADSSGACGLPSARPWSSGQNYPREEPSETRYRIKIV